MDIRMIDTPALRAPLRPTATRNLDSQQKGVLVPTTPTKAFMSQASGPPLARTPHQKQKNPKKQKKQKNTLQNTGGGGRETQQHDIETPGVPPDVNAPTESRPTTGHSLTKPTEK